jgi:hypothetical protein
MTTDFKKDDILFVVETSLGFRVRVSHSSWERIVALKHPVMEGKEDEVRKALSSPDEVRLSKADNSVYLFYLLKANRRWVCAVSKRLQQEEGFLITSYLTDAVKEGERIWPR